MNPVEEIVQSKIYDKIIPLRAGMTVVDIGSCIGFFALYAEDYVGASGKIIAFEPEPESYASLVKNAAKYSNIVPVQKAVSDKSGKMTLHLSKVHTGSTLYVENQWFPANESVEVDVCRLDEELPAMGINHVDFVKIDTEGAGQKILDGASGIMSKIDNFAIAAYHAPYESPDEMVKLLKSYGFRTKILRRYGITPYVYATRDPKLSLDYIESWRVGALFGLGLLAYAALR